MVQVPEDSSQYNPPPCPSAVAPLIATRRKTDKGAGLHRGRGGEGLCTRERGNGETEPGPAAPSAVSEPCTTQGTWGPGTLPSREVFRNFLAPENIPASRSLGRPCRSCWWGRGRRAASGLLAHAAGARLPPAGPQPAGGLWPRGDRPHQCCRLPRPVSGPVVTRAWPTSGWSSGRGLTGACAAQSGTWRWTGSRLGTEMLK